MLRVPTAIPSGCITWKSFNKATDLSLVFKHNLALYPSLRQTYGVITKTAVINDLHRPFHDPKSLETVLNIIEDSHVDRIIINGDLMDMYNVNSHGPKHPAVGTILDDEIQDTRLWLQGLRDRFPKTEIVFLFGNHEDRLERFILRNCKELFEVLRLEKLLGLKDLQIKVYPYNTRYQIERSNVYVQHSPPSYAKNGAMTSLERDIDESSIYGCSHRQQVAVRTGKSGKQYYCYFNGWLGSTRVSEAHEKVFSYVKGHESWQQCFCMVTVENKTEAWIEQISIQNGRAFYEGAIYG